MHAARSTLSPIRRRVLVGAACLSLALAAPAQRLATEETPLVTGRIITPLGKQAPVGSFPCNMLLSPDGKYLVVTDSGYREYLSVLSVDDGHLVSQLEINASLSGKPEKEALYYGLAWGDKTADGQTLYVSRGDEQTISRYALHGDGQLALAGAPISLASPPSQGRGSRVPPTVEVAGLAWTGGPNGRLFAVDNNTGPFTGMAGHLHVMQPDGSNASVAVTPGFPLAVAAMPDGRAYVSSERDGVVSVIDGRTGRVVKNVLTGNHPASLLLNRSRSRLFVANSGSDTISILNTATNRVERTVLLRPAGVRGLAGATPLGMALGPADRRLYVALGDMNAVAVVDVKRAALLGYIPTGWYPTCCAVSPEGFYLFVANAKGVEPRNPNGHDVGSWGRYIQNIIEGTVSAIPMPRDDELPRLSRTVLTNDRVSPAMLGALRLMTAGANGIPNRAPIMNPGIDHVIYIIKENRTYDQVLGDLKQANGDPALCMFGRSVTPNEHALAERFALLDNFYDCAEVSADGWTWSTTGMTSEYVARNTPYNYSGRGRVYDEEGQNNGVPVDLKGIPDVARPPGGYIWDAVARKGLSYRNYGFFLSFAERSDTGPDGRPIAVDNTPNKRALVGHTDTDFREFDLAYTDSDAWQRLNAPFPRQVRQYGGHHSASRFSEWKREFDHYVALGSLPSFISIRLPRDHTAGTQPGLNTPRGMVADNDYAVGEVVDAVSRSPFWKRTAIFVIEDDAQNGNDHVDAHRSVCLVISPYIKRGTVDHRFYNTDSVLRTMEILLGLQPMCQYDATASPFAFLATAVDNDAPYRAILPDRSIIAEVNTRTSYRARDSERLDFSRADAVPDDVLTDIVWHSVKGSGARMPQARHGGMATASVTHDADDK